MIVGAYSSTVTLSKISCSLLFHILVSELYEFVLMYFSNLMLVSWAVTFEGGIRLAETEVLIPIAKYCARI